MRATFAITRGALIFAIVALLLLTGLSWGVAYLDLGGWDTVVALVIATAKVLVVAVVFMELGEETGAVRLVAIAIPLWFLIMILLMVSDVALR